MSGLDVQLALLRTIADSDNPVCFADLRSVVAVTLDTYSLAVADRSTDRALQRLRREGRVRHVRKAQGGPGWVMARPDDEATLR